MAEAGLIFPKIQTFGVAIVASNSQETALVPSEHTRSAPRVECKAPVDPKVSSQLDSWPVHPLRPAGSNLSLGSTASYSRQQQMDSGSQAVRVSQNKVSIIPKPKFLEYLESYLAKELRLLGCSQHGPSDLRLQAHREAFEYLINEFKTYKPILSTIKNEYEMYVDHIHATLLRLKPLESQLAVVKEECDRKVLMLREEEKEDLKTARREIKDLHGVVDQKREKLKTLEAQIARLQEELGNQYDLYRNEADARKLLISDINDLRVRQQEMKASASSQSEQEEDPVVLKLKLARAREDLKVSNRRINTMLADYGDVVPRRDYEGLEGSFQTLESEHEQIKTDHLALMEEHSTIQDLHRQVCEEKASMEKELLVLKRTATPRPDWSRCGDYVDGGPEKWQSVSEGQASDYLMDMLLAEIANVDISEIRKDDNFQAMGIADNVPAHLRGEGFVKNLHLNKKDLNQIIDNFWKYRLSHDSPAEMMMDEVMAQYLAESAQQDKMAALETAYSVHDACIQMPHEVNVRIFHEIILGKLEEVVYRRWLQTTATLSDALSKAAQGKDELSPEQFQTVLGKVFPSKAPDSLASLTSLALESSPTASLINLGAALNQDPMGRPSQLAANLLEQSRAECKIFAQNVVQILGDKSSITVEEFGAAILAVCPQISKDEVTRVTTQLYGVDPAEVQNTPPDVAIPTENILQKLIQLDLQQV